MRILVTGGAGYIGTILINALLEKGGADNVAAVDLLPQPKNIKESGNLHWTQHDLAKNGWQEKILREGAPDVIVHLAFKIRSPYGRIKETENENIAACENIFRFAFENSVPKLIYTSSVAAYGARKENIGKLLKETDPLMEDKSPYGMQKKLVEEKLSRLAGELKPQTHTAVLRLNSVTGPYGQGIKSKFGLITFLKKLLPFVMETDPEWARQFIHEKDVLEMLSTLIYAPAKNGSLETYNAAPPKFLTARDMAKLLGKKVIKLPKWKVRPLFFLAWHLTLGRIPTHPDSAAGLIYPINVDGSKIQETGFRYKFGPEDAFLGRG